MNRSPAVVPGIALTWRDRLLARWRQRNWRGYHLLQRLIAGQGRIVFETPYKTRFLLDPSAYIDGRVISDGFYESEVLEALRPELHAGAVLWDVGANFGLQAITAASVGADCTVVAFEPNPTEHARLLQHRAWNAPQLITSSLALSDRPGLFPLFLGPSGNSGMSTLSPWSQAVYTGEVFVATARGDDVIAAGHIPAPTVVKLDVEGHEAAVLRGMSAAIAHPRCTLIVLEDGPDDDTPAKQILRGAGFEIEPLQRRERTEHALLNFVARKHQPATDHPGKRSVHVSSGAM